jgi:hypothetical protein
MHRTSHPVAPSLPGPFVTMRLAQLGLPGVSAFDLSMPQVVPDTLPARLTAVQQRTIDAATFLEHDIPAVMTGLGACGVVFKEDEEPDRQTQDGLFEDDIRFKARWFPHTNGNILGLEQLP